MQRLADCRHLTWNQLHMQRCIYERTCAAFFVHADSSACESSQGSSCKHLHMNMDTKTRQLDILSLLSCYLGISHGILRISMSQFEDDVCTAAVCIKTSSLVGS